MKFDGVLYRFEEYNQLAHIIIRLFDNDEIVKTYSNNSRERIRSYFNSNSDAHTLLNIYRSVIDYGN